MFTCSPRVRTRSIGACAGGRPSPFRPPHPLRFPGSRHSPTCHYRTRPPLLPSLPRPVHDERRLSPACARAVGRSGRLPSVFQHPAALPTSESRRSKEEGQDRAVLDAFLAMAADRLRRGYEPVRRADDSNASARSMQVRHQQISAQVPGRHRHRQRLGVRGVLGNSSDSAAVLLLVTAQPASYVVRCLPYRPAACGDCQDS